MRVGRWPSIITRPPSKLASTTTQRMRNHQLNSHAPIASTAAIRHSVPAPSLRSDWMNGCQRMKKPTSTIQHIKPTVDSAPASSVKCRTPSSATRTQRWRSRRKLPNRQRTDIRILSNQANPCQQTNAAVQIPTDLSRNRHIHPPSSAECPGIHGMNSALNSLLL